MVQTLSECVLAFEPSEAGTNGCMAILKSLPQRTRSSAEHADMRNQQLAMNSPYILTIVTFAILGGLVLIYWFHTLPHVWHRCKECGRYQNVSGRYGEPVVGDMVGYDNVCSQCQRKEDRK